MAWICTDCGEEMRPEILAVSSSGNPSIPIGWGRMCSKEQTEWGERWDHWAQHDACSQFDNNGRVEWVPFPGTTEAPTGQEEEGGSA